MIPRDESPGKYGVPDTGSPLHAAVIGVADLDRSVAFYRDQMGLDLVGTTTHEGSPFWEHWRVPPRSTARVAVLADRGCEAGRIALIEFKAEHRELVRIVDGQRFFGLVNLNFYTNDIHSHTSRLSAVGCRPWSAPVVHDMGTTIGRPIEVMIDGPDTVILNLIELQAPNPEARIMRTLAYIHDTGGFNRCGTTALATSQHCVRDYTAGIGFYQQVLGMSIRNDTTLAGAGMELFMRYPAGAQTRDTYLQGNHIYGKIAVNHPLNFECADLVERARAPNIGYLAQAFVVADLNAALQHAVNLGSPVFSNPATLEFPGLGTVRSALVHNPGSGALQQLLQRH